MYLDLGVAHLEFKGHEQGFERPWVVVKSLGNIGSLIIVSFS